MVQLHLPFGYVFWFPVKTIFPTVIFLYTVPFKNKYFNHVKIKQSHSSLTGGYSFWLCSVCAIQTANKGLFYLLLINNG